jgi:hypothetical protein
LDDDSLLTLYEVLGTGPSELRTNKNFPIVRTVIAQRAHIFSLGYQYSDTLSFHIALPLIKQATDHTSSIPNYEEFLIETSGFGDAVLSVNYKFVNENEHQWWFGFGVSFPTGSIDEVGDTPRGLGDMQLPYTMQLGSGTMDLPMEFNYQHIGNHDFSLSFYEMLRTGSNDHNYRLGNNYRISAKYKVSFECQTSTTPSTKKVSIFLKNEKIEFTQNHLPKLEAGNYRVELVQKIGLPESKRQVDLKDYHLKIMKKNEA